MVQERCNMMPKALLQHKKKPFCDFSHLKEYTNQRLLGEHIPYPVEAYPEGNQHQLSAESGLYARVFTEGLFEIRPTGFKSFTCNPHLPERWDKMSLRGTKAFKSNFDLEVTRIGKNDKRLKVIENDKVIFDRTLDNTEVFEVNLTK